MATAIPREELDQLVRTLSHDMNANFMVLESSFAQLKKSVGRLWGEKKSPDELHQQVAHVEACLRESKRFLADLDGLARTGAVEMQPSRVNLAAVVHQVLFEQRELLAESNVEVDVRRPLPIVWCNQGRLKQIVTNLLRNAVHHGCNPQQPRIRIAPAVLDTTEESGENSGSAAFRIHDNGPGIERRFHREIFLPGRRLSQSGAAGSGMGLAIVKKIVDHYGGSVYVDPDCETGTAFVVSLPGPSGQTPRGPSAGTAGDRAGGPDWKLGLDGRHPEHRRPRHGRLAPQQRHGD